jgi:hypothetical protein
MRFARFGLCFLCQARHGTLSLLPLVKPRSDLFVSLSSQYRQTPPNLRVFAKNVYGVDTLDH